MGIVLSLKGLLSVTPLLVLLLAATRVCLRDVAYHASLIPVVKRCQDEVVSPSEAVMSWKGICSDRDSAALTFGVAFCRGNHAHQ